MKETERLIRLMNSAVRSSNPQGTPESQTIGSIGGMIWHVFRFTRLKVVVITPRNHPRTVGEEIAKQIESILSNAMPKKKYSILVHVNGG